MTMGMGAPKRADPSAPALGEKALELTRLADEDFFFVPTRSVST